ncbi:MAG: rod-binding protein [Alphaproteobacteria bacterium]
MTDPILNPGALSAPKVGGAQGADSPNLTRAKDAAQEFEAIFLSQMLATMTQELGGAGGVAGGDDVYRDMFTQEVAKMISRSGGIGVADTILQEMLKTQEIG